VATLLGNPRLNLLAITVYAPSAGGDTWEEVEHFGKAKHDWRKRFLQLPKQPSCREGEPLWRPVRRHSAAKTCRLGSSARPAGQNE
jgi:hypothetical protein